jgi:GNAT superfamily N-acetyltransferase
VRGKRIETVDGDTRLFTSGECTIRVRAVRPDDRDFVLAQVVRLAAFGTPPGRTSAEIVEGEARTLRAFFDAPDGPDTLIIAEADNRPSGFVLLEEKQDYFTLNRHGHIGILVVTREGEGRGIAAALIRAAEAWARSRGHQSLTLNVFEGNRRARAVYEHSGFRPDTVKYLKTL